MVEGGGAMAQEEEVLEALFFAEEQLHPLLELMKRIGPGDWPTQAAVCGEAGLSGIAPEDPRPGPGQDSPER